MSTALWPESDSGADDGRCDCYCELPCFHAGPAPQLNHDLHRRESDAPGDGDGSSTSIAGHGSVTRGHPVSVDSRDGRFESLSDCGLGHDGLKNQLNQSSPNCCSATASSNFQFQFS